MKAIPIYLLLAICILMWYLYTKVVIITRTRLIEGRLITAVLTRNYKPNKLDYELPKGMLVQVRVHINDENSLYIAGECVDTNFPYDAAELLE